MTINHPTPDRLPILCQLWKTAFGDTDEFLDNFFQTAFSPLRCLCALSNEETAGALYWFDVSVDNRKLAYLYAVATHPSHRGKGVCRGLMTAAHTLLKEQGYAGALLVPQTESLREMYSGFDYRSCTTVSETFCAAGDSPVPIHQIDVAEYARLRREWLPEGSVIQEGENLRFLAAQATFYRGNDFLLAAREEEAGSLFGMELLGSVASAPGILKALGCGQGTFRTPGGKKKFAMFLPLTEKGQPPRYFGLPFD